jgi:two-component system nitrogen regulation sensor histidine kinase NtrY
LLFGIQLFNIISTRRILYKMKRGKYHLILSGISIFLMLGAIIFDHSSVLSLNEISEKANKNIELKAALCKQALNLALIGRPGEYWGNLDTYYDEEKIGVYLWEGDSIVFWNNAQIPVGQNILELPKQQGLARLTQGYYIYFKQVQNEKTAVALCLLKPQYELQNNYLKNDFKEWTGIPKGIKIDAGNLSKDRVMLGGEKLFSLKGGEKKYYSSDTDNAGFIIFFAGFLMLLISILLIIKETVQATKITAWVSLVLLLRILMIGLKWPAFFYRTELYDLQLFGNAQSSVNGYLGDILMNAVTLLFFASVVHFQPVFLVKRVRRFAYSFSVIILIFLAFNQFNQTAISLITNSTLSFDFLSIFSIKFQAFIGLAALSMYSLTLFILVNRSISFFNNKSWPEALKFLLLFLCICIVQQVFSHRPGFLENYWLVGYALIMFALIKLYGFRIPLALGVQILVMSVVTSKIFNTYITKNQQQDLGILSIKLSEKQDAILESEFAGISGKITKDENLNNLLELLADIPTAQKETELLLKQKYFGGYFDRYTIDFSLFDKDCHPLLEVRQGVFFNQGFFEDQIRGYSDSTVVAGLFFVKNYRKNAQYIGKINLKDKNLFVLMEPKQFEELGSFPDLLLDQSQQKPEKLKTFSHAVYRSQQITNRYGDFNYPFFLQDSSTLAKSDANFIHQYYHPDENTSVIISQNAKKWNYFFTFNSYMLLFFSLMTYICYLVYSAVFTSHFTSPTLTRRIQTIIIVLLLLAMSAVGITSGNLVSDQFENDNKKELEEKTQIIINELTGQFKTQQLFDASQKELINLKLKEYARLFNTPISLFYKNGELFNTSESKLYDLGLAASLVNPKAFWKLSLNQSSSESVTDKAGTLKYLSLYTPLFDSKKELAGFINLPYFAKQGDLVNELSGIISALINVYVILFVISILAGLILSGLITQPLRLIKQQLSNVTLGRQNEKIAWQSNDEIGKLVSEYNQMLVKLENSANLLAQSERESAWREMAKQVAHEIKNPLTPMKLNLQYLQHLMKNDPEEFKEKFEKSSAGIIEQIDSLANIANEFSNFAKLPGTQLHAINLAEIISSSVLIFENQKNINIENRISEPEIFVKGDKDQCLRVFNNILKNASQALDEVKDPQIIIQSERNAETIIISIGDNGCGIEDELKPKIFTPNFTTKTTGSGLGLAMVKNSMLGFGGNIWFNSEKKKGTTFYLEFILTKDETSQAKS